VRFRLDTLYLARFALPDMIRISLRGEDGKPFVLFSLPVMLEYGYCLPPLLSNSQGEVFVTREVFEKALREHLETGIMDARGADYSLNRHVRIRVPSREEGLRAAKARQGSGWPLLPLERAIHNDIESLLRAYVPACDIYPEEYVVDLADEKPYYEVSLTVRLTNASPL
jgi:hypothetical protein